MIILAIDPGSERSGWLVLDAATEAVLAFGKTPNEELLEALRFNRLPTGALGLGHVVVIEFMAPRGMSSSAQEFETLWWAGRFAEAARPTPVERLLRITIKKHLCGQTKANDVNIRAALIDRFGGIGGKAAAVGVKAAKGPLYGISNDVWAALAVAVSWADGARSEGLG